MAHIHNVLTGVKITDGSDVLNVNPDGTLPVVSGLSTTGFSLNSAATTNPTSVKGSAGSIYALAVSNNGDATAFVKFYDMATAPSVGASVVAFFVPVGPQSFVALPISAVGIKFSSGIALAVTAGAPDTDATAVSASQVKVWGQYV